MIDFDPALAIGTADEFVAKPLPVQCKRTWKEKEAERRKSPYAKPVHGTYSRKRKKQDGRAISVEADFEAVVAQSQLFQATDRALRVRTAAAFDSVCSLLGRPSRKEFAPLAAFAARRALAALREGR